MYIILPVVYIKLPSNQSQKIGGMILQSILQYQSKITLPNDTKKIQSKYCEVPFR
jgi:hypothetical protein